VLQREQWQRLRVERGRNRPADYSAAEDIGDERDVTEPGENPNVGDAGDPQLLRPVRDELPAHEVGPLVLSGRGTRGDWLATSADALEASALHQSRATSSGPRRRCSSPDESASTPRRSSRPAGFERMPAWSWRRGILGR